MSTVQNERGTAVRSPSEVSYGRPASSPSELEVERSARVVAGAFTFSWLAGAAGVVLTILALANLFPALFTSIVVIVLGAGMMIEGLSVAIRARQLPLETGGTSRALARELSVETLVGAAGIILGILSLIGLLPVVLTAVATIAFGAALMFGGETFRLHQLEQSWAPLSAHETVWATAPSAGGEEMTGFGATVLGILALLGMYSSVLLIVALLAISGIMLLRGLVTSAHMVKLLK